MQPVLGVSLLQSDDEELTLDLNGDVKSFTTLSFPYKHPLLFPSTDPMGSGALELRAKLKLRAGEHFKLDFHPTLSVITRAGSSLMNGGAGALAQAGGLPEAIVLSKAWPAADDAAEQLRFGVDRLVLSFSTERLSIKLGRQALSFGTTFFFSPMDLVAPFSATTIDREYKTGADALRGDLYIGETGTLSLVAVYAGDWNLAGSVLAAHGGLTLDVFDLGLFLGLVHKDLVLGLDSSGSVGSVGLRAEATLTSPAEGGDLFVRAVLGADHHFEGGVDLSGELYFQSKGATKSADYFAQLSDPRVLRGERWTLGQSYLALSFSYELHPLVKISLFAVGNLRDPSAILGPGLSWSISDEVNLESGLYLGVGERPSTALSATGLDLGSEFGLLPSTAYLVLRAYL